MATNLCKGNSFNDAPCLIFLLGHRSKWNLFYLILLVLVLGICKQMCCAHIKLQCNAIYLTVKMEE